MNAACHWQHFTKNIKVNNYPRYSNHTIPSCEFMTNLITPTPFVNEGMSAASFCRWAAALVPDMFYNFYLAKNHKIVNNSATTDAKEKISTDLES